MNIIDNLKYRKELNLNVTFCIAISAIILFIIGVELHTIVLPIIADIIAFFALMIQRLYMKNGYITAKKLKGFKNENEKTD